MSDEWESVRVPGSNSPFIGWGIKPGQHVTGKVLSYGDRSGRTQKNDPVPQIEVELIEPAASFNKFQERTDYEAGTEVKLTASQKNLERNLIAAQPRPGDLIKITLEKLVPSGEGQAKLFDVKIKRNSGGPAPQPAPVQAPPQQAGFGDNFDDEPPF